MQVHISNVAAVTQLAAAAGCSIEEYVNQLIKQASDLDSIRLGPDDVNDRGVTPLAEFDKGFRIEKNELNGSSVILGAEDSIEMIPVSHVGLLTSQLQLAFESPQEFLEAAIERCQIVSMQKWLESLRGASWELELHQDEDAEFSQAGMRYYPDNVQGALISPSIGAPENLPDAFRHVYDLVGYIYWNEFGDAGGIHDSNHPSIEEVTADFEPSDEGFEDLFVWGSSTSGHSLVWTSDDQCGWYLIHRHESGRSRNDRRRDRLGV